MKEIWKPVPDERFENDYQVSNLGRVRSLDKIVKRSNGRPHTRKGKILKPALDTRGYYRCAFSLKEHGLVTFKVHRLVAMAFVGNPDDKPQVNHIDGNKVNNRFDNLEFVTHDENIEHAIENGLIKMEYSEEERRRSVNKVIKRGELNGLAKLTEEAVREIRRKYIPTVYTRKMLAKEFGVKVCTIKDVLSGRSWKHVA